MTMAVTAPGPPPEYEHMMTTSNNMLVDHHQQHQRATFEECRSKWHSTGHVPTLTTTGFRTSLPTASVSSGTAHSESKISKNVQFREASKAKLNVF